MLTTPLGQRIVVRFTRKPLWAPTAPSKLFRIAEHNFYSPEEITQIKKLYHAYYAQMHSLEKFMFKEFFEPASQAGGIPVSFIEKETEEVKELLDENDRLNAETAVRRQQYFDKHISELENQVLEEKMSREDALIEAGQKLDDYIKRQKALANPVVTEENFDQIIEDTMANPVNFEFCIDKQGRKRK